MSRSLHALLAFSLLLPIAALCGAQQTVDTATVRGRIEDPAGFHSYSRPSIAVNLHGDALIGYSRFGMDLITCRIANLAPNRVLVVHMRRALTL